VFHVFFNFENFFGTYSNYPHGNFEKFFFGNFENFFLEISIKFNQKNFLNFYFFQSN